MGGIYGSTFCVPIISGVVGTMCSKMLPLSLADDIRLEFTLESLPASCVSNTATIVSNWSIISWELELAMLELGDDGMNMVEQITPFTQPIYIHGSSYRHYTSTLAQGVVGSQSLLIPSRFASLRQIVMCPRRNTEATSALGNSISSRINPNIDSYAFRCGSLMVPQKQVFLRNYNTTLGYAEGFMETLRSQHSNADSTFAPSITRAQYGVGETVDISGSIPVATTTIGNSYGNAFAIAQEFESISNRSDCILSGTNTLNLQLFHDFTIGSAVSTSGYTIDYYALYDHIIVLDPTGLLSVKF
jgi:hypothetical protein